MRRGALLGLALIGLWVVGCDGEEGPPDSGPPMDAGPPPDAGPDAGPDPNVDAGGICGELTPQFCPRQFPMTPIPVELICDSFAELFCEAQAACCTRSEWTYASVGTCVAEQQQRCEDMMRTLEHLPQVQSGNIQYSQAAAGMAYSVYGSLATDCQEVDFTQVIQDIYDGQLMRNDPCEVTAECQDGLTCEDLGFGLQCSPGLGLGGLCDTNADCVSSDLRCDTAAMECAARFPDGSGCTDDYDCESEYCEEGTCTEVTAENMYCVRNIGDRDYPAFRP